MKEESGITGSMRQLTHVQQEDFQLDPTSSVLLRAKQMDMNAFKRRSYAEGTFESYDSMVHRYGRISEHYDELDARSEQLFREKRYPLEPGLTRNRFSSFNSKHVKDGLGILERFRQNRTTQHQYNESAEQPRHWYDQKNHEEACLTGLPLHPPLVNYEPSNASKEVRHGSNDFDPVADGRLGQKIQKRPNIGQSYACQKSPTQKQVLDPKMLFTESSLGRKSDDQPTKHGLRRWRIGSYFRDQDEHPKQLEDVSAPDESQNNNEVLHDSRQNRAPLEKPLFRESAQITSYKHLDLYNSKSPKTDLSDDQSLSSDKGYDERNVKLAKHESIRSKLNPMLQRSRLRSSLIFNNSKTEQHITQKGKGIQSIREQKQEEEKESEGIQESKAAADLQKSSSNDQTKPIQYSMPDRTFPNETSKTSEPNLKEVFTGKKLDLDLGWQQTDSAFGSHDPDTQSSDQHEARSKVDLQLSKKVQDAISKMTQRTSLSKEIKTPYIQSAKTEKLPLEKPGKAINSAARQQDPPPSQLAVGSLQPGLLPSESATLNNASNPQRSSSSLKLEDADGNLAKIKMHSSTLCLDTREGKEDKAGGESTILNSISKSPSRLKSFLNLPGDTKSKEMHNNVDLAQPLTSVKENEKNPEKLSKTVQSEVVLSNSEKEEKPRRPPANPTAPKGLQTVQGSRYSTSTSNALYSSNLRDDTKVILEQISANSQKNRAESAKVQHASTSENVTPGESKEKVTPESDKTDSDKKQQFGISSRFSNSIKNKGKAQATPDYVDPLIKRMDSFRKEKRVYSRFEVFYKKDDSLKTEDTSAGQQ
eukprot:g45618.t1